MNKIIDAFKRSRLTKIVLIFLAGVILLINTACSPNSNTMAKNVDSNYPDQPRPSDNGLFSGGDTQRTRRENPPTYRLDPNMEQKMRETYTPTAPKAGMNQGLDVNTRQKDNYAASQKKADELIERAEKRLDKNSREGDRERRASARGIRENIDPGRAAAGVSDSVDDMRRGARRGFENLKDNVGSAIDDTSDTVKDAIR